MTKRFFVQPACGAYGARVYLESGSSYHGTLKALSMWKGADKRVEGKDGTLFLGYEMSELHARDVRQFLIRENLTLLPLVKWDALQK
jgi:hypothetical protein